MITSIAMFGARHAQVRIRPSKGGALYFVSFIYDFSRKVWLSMLKSKADVFVTFDAVEGYGREADRQTGEKIEAPLCKCNGGEYT